jgi:hypothetical protein
MRWLDSIKATGLRLEALKEMVQNKKNGECWWKKRNSEQSTHQREINSGQGNGKPLLNINYCLDNA